jgi:signal transduction histidine kinase
MDLKSLLQPGGQPLKAIPYLLAVSFVGASGPLVVALQFEDYLWALGTALFSTYTPFYILAVAYALWAAFGTRLAAPAGLALAVIAGCLAGQATAILVAEEVMGVERLPGKGYAYLMGLVRGPMLWWGLAAAAWYAMKRAEAHAAEVAHAQLAGEELRASSAEARLQALQAQVEPHFLFNTLAHVKSLYRRDPARGRHMLDRLLDYLRAALPQVRQAATTLEQELELARAYLDIQQIRIGGRLAFSIEVPGEIARLRFPPLMLLTLVENAIKHGIAPQTEGGTIRIAARADDRQLRIEVRDTGAGLHLTAGSGLGLANVRERLAALFGAGARLVIEPNNPRGVVAAIEIPR